MESEYYFGLNVTIERNPNTIAISDFDRNNIAGSSNNITDAPLIYKTDSIEHIPRFHLTRRFN